MTTASPAQKIAAPEQTKAETLIFDVRGMTCASCVARVERAIRKVPGVTSANVNLATEKATVFGIPGAVQVLDLQRQVEDAGYELTERATGIDTMDAERATEQRRLLVS